ncbi:TetR/AcrR family transcriptional regulator [Microbacterium sp. bgisy207]|jgi:AcrR family transcriptional regulator|uniref:TetR/AcrR family transcriptional regulator n=1 Tax=Microbacterium sp. bgisy207 TaxID=3413800 RepID=UPI003EBD0205
MAQRGSYAKGVAKREEILERALDVIATEGYSGASVKRIAEAVGLSQAGLLHYFDSKEELFTEVLRKRDEHDAQHFGVLPDVAETDSEKARAGFVRVIRHNADVPGLVELFSRLAVEAAHPDHPAHAYFVERGTALREAFALTPAPETLSPDVFARILQAVADGLQLQWLLDPTIDMAEIVDQLFAALQPRESSTR